MSSNSSFDLSGYIGWSPENNVPSDSDRDPEMRNALATIGNLLTSRKNEADSAKEKSEFLQHRVEELVAITKKQADENVDLNTRLDDFGNTLSILVKQNMQQDVDIKSLKAEVGALKVENTVLKAEVEALKVENSVLKVEVEALKVEVFELKEQTGSLKADVAEINAKLGIMRG